MKHLYKYTLLLALLLSTATLWAQAECRSGLRFASLSHDFGYINEAAGVVTCRFTATNSTSGEITVSDVITTCGCTKAHYGNGAIAPSGEFILDITFDPTNRPGRIDRHIYVHVSDATEPLCLHITGHVEPRERTIEELYPFDMGGGLRLASNFHAFGYVEEDKSVEHSIECINTSDRTITLTLDIIKASGHLTVEDEITIAPHTRGDIALRYVNSTECPYYGIAEDRLQLVVDGTTCNYEVATHAIMVDNFDLVDDISAPKLVISKNIIKFGEINGRNDVVERSVVLKNDGASPLLVREIAVSNAAVEVAGERTMSIAPGASAVITLVLRSTYIEDWDNPLTGRAMVITNDPLRPMQTIKFTALPL